MFDFWWIYVVAAGLVACVVIQAWDRRRRAERGNRQEEGRVETEAELQAERSEGAKQAWGRWRGIAGAMSAPAMPHDRNVHFWRQAGSAAWAAGLPRAANPFMRLCAFEATVSCAAAWLEGWIAADEGHLAEPAFLLALTSQA
jgi:hypothetical protein